jgi:hypothetical protein
MARVIQEDGGWWDGEMAAQAIFRVKLKRTGY